MEQTHIMATDLKHYLDYYKTIQLPGYAVLVTGDWGIGKTHQVKHCLSDTKHLYVSLFGLASTDAIRLSVISNLAASSVDSNQTSITNALPALGNVITNLEKFKSLGRLAQGVAESLLSDTLRSHYVIVFDDLERSLPIRLSPTPTICSVSPWTAGKGRRRRIEEAIRLILDCSENRTGV